MAGAKLIDLLSQLKGTRVIVHIDGNLKVAGVLDDVESDYVVVEEKFIVPMARIGYVARSTAAL